MYSDYRIVRDAKRLTDYKVAKATGISRSTFSDWKSGRSSPKLEKLRKIADFLEVPVEFITGEETIAPPLDTLSAEEVELLHIFRLLTKEKQISLLDYARYQSEKEQPNFSKVG